jgi:transposase
MSEEEVRRAGVRKRVKTGELTQVEAAEMLGLSYRQVKRLYGRYLEGGAKALVHSSAGKPSNRARPGEERKQVLALVRKHYGGGPGERFGPTLTAEHLHEDHGIAVDPETLRRWMLAEGLWTKERKRKPYRQRRERRAHFGELVQMDGSFENWLEGRGPRGCLIHMVDDATSTSLATFDERRRAGGGRYAAGMGKYGIPRALYVDWKRSITGADGAPEAGRHCADFAVRGCARSWHRADRSQLGTGEGARGARPRHTPGSAD